MTANAWIATTDRDGFRTYVRPGGYWARRTGSRQWSAWHVDGGTVDAGTLSAVQGWTDTHEHEHAPAPVVTPAPAVTPAPVAPVDAPAAPAAPVVDAPAPDTLDGVRATLAAARAARGNRRPAPRPDNYVPTPDPRGDGVDWTPALGGAPLARYVAVSAILESVDPSDPAATVAHPDAPTGHVDGVQPDRAILAGDWTDGHADDPAADRAHEIARWALRQPADAIAILPVRNIIRDAVDIVTETSDRMDFAIIADAVAHGMCQADASGRIMVSTLARVTGLGMEFSDRKRRAYVSAILDAWIDAVATVADPMIDAAENGTPVQRVTVPVVRPVVTRHGVGYVTGTRTVAHGITFDREVHGIATTVDRAEYVAMRADAFAGRTWTARRADGTTWTATDGARSVPARTVAHPETGAPVALPAVTLPGAFRRVERVRPDAPDVAPVVVTVDPARVRAARGPVPMGPGAVVDIVRPASADAVVTVRADLTRAAVADDFARVRNATRTRTVDAPAAPVDAPAAAPVGSARDRLRARASMRRTRD